MCIKHACPSTERGSYSTPMKFYGYKSCDTCRKAKKWLDARGIEFEEMAIRETPPPRDELERMLEYLGGDIKRLFNTSSKDYRALGGKNYVAGLTPDEVFAALMDNGNLIKRPFVLTDKTGTVGFKPEVWDDLF